MKKILLVLMCLLAMVGCDNGDDDNEKKKSIIGEIDKPAKYVFLFIGDGMSNPQIAAAEFYTENVEGYTPLTFDKFPAQGRTTTRSTDSYITDSAAAGTALATGHKTNSGVISMDTSQTISYKTLAEIAKEEGKKVGIVSSVSIDHATPAVFYAHEPSRNSYYEIANKLVTSDFDYFAGGGLKGNTDSKRKDENGELRKDLLEVAAENNFTYTDTREEFYNLKAGVGKVIAVAERLTDGEALPYEIDRAFNELSLADFTEKGIDLLKDAENGFFMMVEGGKIDWACHANDGASSIIDTIAFDKAVQKAIDFYNEYPEDTLIVVTGDHETGGLSLGFSGTGYSNFYEKLSKQTCSYDEAYAKYKEFIKDKTSDEITVYTLKDMIKNSYGFDVLTDEEYNVLKTKADNGDETANSKLAMTLNIEEREELENALVASKVKEFPAEAISKRALSNSSNVLYGYYHPFVVTLGHLMNYKSGIAFTSYSHTGEPVTTVAKGTTETESLFVGYYDNTEIYSKILKAMGLGLAKAIKQEIKENKNLEYLESGELDIIKSISK